MGHWNGLLPVPSIDFLDFGEIARPNPQNNLFRCYLFRPGPFEKSWEFAKRTRANIIERGYLLAKLFVPPRQNLRAIKSQFTNDFRKKSDLFDVRFD